MRGQRRKLMNRQIQIGDRFKRLLVVACEGRRDGHLFYLCQCDCGAETTQRKDALIHGGSVSCGCYAREAIAKRARKHGMSGATPEYQAWAHMIRRCHTPTTESYKYYGARGIIVCDRWRLSFENFYADMGPRPSPKHSIDRIDNNGNYEPSNCRWATTHQQASNTRKNQWLTFRGETKTVSEWTRVLGFPREVIRSRLARGWSVEQALTLPPDAGESKRIMAQARKS